MNLPRIRLYLALAILAPPLFPAAGLAQEASEPASALSAALSAACRAEPSQFERYLTADSAAAFHGLPDDQKAAFLKRFSLSEETGKPLVSNSGTQNHPVVRCEAPGGTAEFRFGDERVHDNLAFIRVDVVDSEQTTFGLIHQDGAWRLLSLGLVMLDVPQLAKQWTEADFSLPRGSRCFDTQVAGRCRRNVPPGLWQVAGFARATRPPRPRGRFRRKLADLLDDELARASPAAIASATGLPPRRIVIRIRRKAAWFRDFRYAGNLWQGWTAVFLPRRCRYRSQRRINTEIWPRLPICSGTLVEQPSASRDAPPALQ